MTRGMRSSGRWLPEHLLRRGESMPLSDMALGTVGQALKPGGGGLIKVFQGAGFPELAVPARGRFEAAHDLEPAASGARSAGMYLLASGRRLV
jgi:23S rRNA (uridine2552-2'-O)-methyltransferase